MERARRQVLATSEQIAVHFRDIHYSQNGVLAQVEKYNTYSLPAQRWSRIDESHFQLRCQYNMDYGKEASDGRKRNELGEMEISFGQERDVHFIDTES